MNKTTKCQPAGDADGVSDKRLEGKGKGRVPLEQRTLRHSLYDVVLRTGQILLALILRLETITDSRGKGMGFNLVCVAFLMATSFG